MFEMISLDYDLNSLNPIIRYDTMYIHYRNYVNNLNKILSKYPFQYNTIVEVIKNIKRYDGKDQKDILFNAGGTLNHEYIDNFFQIISFDKINAKYEEIV